MLTKRRLRRMQVMSCGSKVNVVHDNHKLVQILTPHCERLFKLEIRSRLSRLLASVKSRFKVGKKQFLFLNMIFYFAITYYRVNAKLE